MVESRLVPALNDGSLQVEELVELIKESEEHGHKHVMMYQFNPEELENIKSMFDPTWLNGWAKEKGLPVAGKYVFAAFPNVPTITEVRVGDGEQKEAIVLKIARTLHRRKPAEMVEYQGREVYIAEVSKYRAVDVVKIHGSGLVEVRVHTRSGAISYPGAALSALNYLDGILQTGTVGDYSLGRARDVFADSTKRPALPPQFELLEAELKNDRGDRMQSSSDPDHGGINGSEVTTGVIDHFSDAGYDAYCERARVTYKIGNTRKINVILTELDNEIIITSNVTRAEYDEILQAVLKVMEIY